MNTLFMTFLVCASIVVAPRSVLAQADRDDRGAEAQKLMALSRAWSDTLAEGNLDAAIDFWAEDAVMMAPDQPPLRGKTAIRDYVMSTTEIPGFEISWEPIEAHVSAAGDLAYLIERNKITMLDDKGDPVVQHNKVVTIWRRQPDGSWKNVVDIWNADPSDGE